MKLKAILSIWTIIGLAVLLRIPYLNSSFWLDEAAQALESARPLTQQFDIIPDFQPPLIHLMVHFALYLGQSHWWLRTVAALIPGLITIWATYKIGVELKSKWVGLSAALLLTTSSFHIFYSQELRPYSLPAMFAVLSWWFLVHVTKSSWSQKAKLGFVLCSVAGLYSSYLYPFLLVSQGVWILSSQRQHLKAFVVIGSLIMLAYLPWLPIFLKQLSTGGQVRQSLPGWEAVVSIPQLKSLPLVAGKFVYGVVDLGVTPYFIISGGAVLVAMAVIVKELSSSRSNKLFKTIQLLLIWGVVPLLTAWIVSFWIPVVQPKRVLFLLPAGYLLLTVGLAELKNKNLRWIILGLFLAINLYGTTAYYVVPRYQRENWQAVHQEILTDYPSDAVVLFAFPEPYAPWRWYDDGSYPTISTGRLHVSEVTDLTAVVKPATNYRFVIVFDYLRDLSDPQRLLEVELEAYGYRLVELKDYPNIGFIRIYGKPGATLSTDTNYETWH